MITMATSWADQALCRYVTRRCLIMLQYDDRVVKLCTRALEIVPSTLVPLLAIGCVKEICSSWENIVFEPGII